MSRHTAPVCHGRRMKQDRTTRGTYRCLVCGTWTARLLAAVLPSGGGR
ncbi:hypothetical protein ACFCZ1_26985 [Streptomyces sp. NPDC056224]